MKILFGAWILLAAWTVAPAAAADLELSIAPQFNGAPLVFDSLVQRTAAGQTISITRLDAMLSDIALRRTDGIWIGQSDWFACMSAREGKTNFILAGIPLGTYDRLRFHIGLAPQINHGDAAQWPAGHPLNPGVNGLYWGWSREYVFLALEGHWQDGGKQNGFSYHLATDRALMTVEVPMALDLTSSRRLQLAMDVGKIFSAPRQIELTDASDTTHSRPNDALALQLKENVESAFSSAVESPCLSPARTASLPRPVMASDATPYRLAFSQFFPQPNLPGDNPLTSEGVALGSKLFFDGRLSADNSESCATCHRPRRAFSQPQRFSRGVDGEIGTRHAMQLENLAWKNSFFWDGRAKTLREQVLQPIQNPLEMHESLIRVVAKVSSDKNYARLFKNAFGSSEVTPDHIARALEQFLLVQVSCDAKFDRVVNGRAEFSEEEKRGFTLFNTEYDPYHGQFGADCFHCHGGPLFQSQNFANNGLDAAFQDSGRSKVTKRAGDLGKFAVPSLRNVALTGPYMHDGRFRTLEEAIEHYCTGVQRSATLDPNLAKHPDGGVPLSQSDKKALAAFLRTLTDERFAAR
ncbi:MAG TPA: MbnP family protein [Candidatus Saccharimonadales bacterium]|nr:MbnP family protein [Candidatus Saccharimonadales bacterium]